MRFWYVGAAMVIAVAGCATAPKDIAPAYVSTMGYEKLDCTQLQAEAQNVSTAALAATGEQKSKANNDAALMGVGLIIAWPALLFLHGNGAEANNLAQLKGQMQAIKTVSDAKQCGIRFEAN